MLCGAADALLFAFFRKHSQALHLAVSCDGLVWDALNADPAAYGGDKPVLRSALGRCSIRDPFLGRDHRGGFVLVATNGEAAVREILVYRSRDLLRWDGGRLLDVKLPAARRTWAPQYSWIEERGAFLVYWSSSTRESRGAFATYAVFVGSVAFLFYRYIRQLAIVLTVTCVFLVPLLLTRDSLPFRFPLSLLCLFYFLCSS